MTLDLAAGYRALREDAGAVWVPRDVVQVGGPDAVDYLQGQLSQDVAGLDLRLSAWSLVLQPQGKVDALVRVSRTGAEEFVLDTDAGWGEAVVARLERFKLRAKVHIEPVDWRCLAVRGPRTASVLLGPSGEPADGAPIRAVIYGSVVGGLDLLGPVAAVARPDGVAEVGADAYEALRIEEGVPVMGAELTERTIPAEVSGMVERAVSFTKGCYTGQELVARIDSRGGHVPRQLRGLVVDGPPPAPGTTIEVGGGEAGVVTSAAAHPDGRAVALAYVRRQVAPPAECRLPGGVVAWIGALPLIS